MPVLRRHRPPLTSPVRICKPLSLIAVPWKRMWKMPKRR
jgi:hypothetical protein